MYLHYEKTNPRLLTGDFVIQVLCNDHYYIFNPIPLCVHIMREIYCRFLQREAAIHSYGDEQRRTIPSS